MIHHRPEWNKFPPVKERTRGGPDTQLNQKCTTANWVGIIDQNCMQQVQTNGRRHRSGGSVVNNSAADGHESSMHELAHIPNSNLETPQCTESVSAEPHKLRTAFPTRFVLSEQSVADVTDHHLDPIRHELKPMYILLVKLAILKLTSRQP